MTDQLFSSGRRAPTRWWRRGFLSFVVLALIVAVGWALTIGGVWVYAWFQLGGLDLRATDADVAALGSVGAEAPADATTVLVALTGPRDPTVPREPELIAPVALIQTGAGRAVPAVLLLPTDLVVTVDGLGQATLAEVHDEGGEDLLTRAVIDYAEVRIDHVVSLTEDALPRLVEVLDDVELCTPTGCTPASPQQIRTAQRSGDDEVLVDTLTDVVRGIGRSMDRASVVRSPLKAKRAIDIVSDEVRTDVSLRGRTLLGFAEALGSVTRVEHDRIPLLRNPRTGEIVPLEEPIMVRFQHLREGTPLEGGDRTDQDLEELVIELVDVAVLNGAGTTGLAADVQVRLETEGFRVIGTGNAASFGRPTTIVAYGPEPETTEAAAVILAQRLGDGVQLEAREQAPTFEGEPVDVLVTVGTDLDPEADTL